MNSEPKKVKVNKNDSFAKNLNAKTGDKKYDLKIVEDKEVNFDKLENDKESKETIKLQISEAGKNTWKDVTDAKVVFKTGHWRNGFYLKSAKLGDVELKDEILDKRLSTSVHTFTWLTYGALAILVVAVLSAIWYFFFSKEDKEEESL
ncbi:MAG: hypothetical protein mread185_000419 [Mycoplasmataceae bacterium]|nr:MAG: hypothetical protein mread185_000419 [Mycoplasmataceae bacterium]